MGELYITLFQCFQAHLDQISITGFKSDKARALLSYLAVEKDIPHERTSLAGLLWPDLSEQVALRNLRSVLANLRTIIEKKSQLEIPIFLVDYRTIHLNTCVASCDVKLFERDLEEGEYQEALKIYHGRLLQEFSSGSSLFEEWQQMRAATLHRKAMAAVHTLLLRSLDEGNLTQALQYARQQLDMDPFNEDGYQEMIYLLAVNGQPGAALVQVDFCRQMLMKEMGAQPSVETALMEQAILKRRKPSIPRLLRNEDSIMLTLPSASPPPMVSRERELRALDDQLSLALNGLGRITFLSGTAGSGKTTLLNAFAAQSSAKIPNLLVLSSTCAMNGEMAGPFYPLREIFTQLIQAFEKSNSVCVPSLPADKSAGFLHKSVLTMLNKVAPDLGSLLRLGFSFFSADPNMHDDDELTVTIQRGSLYQQAFALLACLAKENPMLITLDDMQWIDADSLHLIEFLGTGLKDVRILVIGAYRSEDIAIGKNGQPHPLVRFFRDPQSAFGNISIDLDRSDGRTFVDEYLDSFPNDLCVEFRETLYHHTEGHALFTVEMVESMKRSGYLKRDEQQRWVTGGEVNWNRLPARVEAIIARRIERLPVFWQHALSVASVAGESFAGEVLAAALDCKSSTIVQGLSRVIDRQHGLVSLSQICMVNGKRLSIFHFKHSAFQQYLYQRLDAAEHSIHHEAIARATEEIYFSGKTDEQISLQIAYHYEKAGRCQKAAGYYYQAGHAAIHHAAFLEAEKYLAHARILLEREPQLIELQLLKGVLTDIDRVNAALDGKEDHENCLPALSQR